MRRLSIIWGTLALLFAGFLAWHTPLKGPLTGTELNTYFEKGLGESAELTTDPAEVRAFFESDDGRPFYMLNLMRFRDQAFYPEGLHPEITSAAEAHAAYGRAVMPLLAARASYPVITAQQISLFGNSMAVGAEAFDTVALVRYRSRRDLLDMITSDAFKAGAVHKWAALDATLVVPTALSARLGPPAVLAIALLALGAALTAVAAYRKRR